MLKKMLKNSCPVGTSEPVRDVQSQNQDSPSRAKEKVLDMKLGTLSAACFFQQNSQRRSVRHAELLAVRARVSSQRPFLTGGGFLVLVMTCGRDAAKLFPQFPGTGCFLPLAVSYRRPFPVAGRFLRLAHHPLINFQKPTGPPCPSLQGRHGSALRIPHAQSSR